MDVTRHQALRHRMVAQGLGRETDRPDELVVLDLGVQDTNVGSARAALSARLRTPAAAAVLDDPSFTLTWAARGAPHLHRTTDLGRLAAAIWPIDDADALARLGAEKASLRAAGIGGTDAFRMAATALAEVVTGPTPKGEASAGVTARLPDACSRWCEPCGTTHVYGGLFQLVGLAAGTGLVPGRSPAVLVPLPERHPVPEGASGTDALLRSYLRLHGPATPADAAAHLGTTPTAIRAAWPDDLAEVSLDGRRTWFPPEDLDALAQASLPTGTVRLVPPADPWLSGRDRDVLVPERAHQKTVWRAIGNPGAVLVDGEVVGVWRAKAAARRRIAVTLQVFSSLAAGIRGAIEDEAERLAAGRDADGATVEIEGG